MPCSWIYIFFLYTCICIHYSSSSLSSSSSSSSSSSYTQHCSSTVPQSTTTIPTNQISIPQLTTTYFSGGDAILGMTPGNETYTYVRKSLTLKILREYYETVAMDVYKVRGFLYMRFPYRQNNDEDFRGNYSSGASYYRRRQPGLITFSLNGFWSKISRKLCMVGSASWEVEHGKIINLDAVLKLNYASENNQTLYTSVISGSLESIGSENGRGYFDPIRIFSFPALPSYNYSMVSNEVGVISNDFDVPRNQSLSLGTDKFCTVVAWRSTYLELGYAMECKEHHHRCSPLGNGVRLIGPSLPRLLYLSPIECSDKERRLRYTATFQNTNYGDQNFSTDTMVIGEALWDDKNNVVFGVACRLFDPLIHFRNVVGDCTMRLSLRYPSILTIRNEARIVGQFWSSKTVDYPEYFRKIDITGSDDNGDVIFPGRGYKYTELDNARKLCPLKKARKKGNTYPDGHSYDMRFDMSIGNSKVERFAGGYATPLCVGEDLHQGYMMIVALAPESATEFVSASEKIKNNHSPINISYKVSIDSYYQFNSSWYPSLSWSINLNSQVEITAEGVYDPETGFLCMVGCRKLVRNSIVSRDCKILVKFEYAPLNARRARLIKGSIESTRAKVDPLYFDELIIKAAAYYVEEANKSIWRMDFEITMVLVSNTLVCIFVGLQIFHVKKNSKVPFFISSFMLLVLSVGHMIPFLLKFDAVFLVNNNNEDTEIVLNNNDSRIEASEVAVRVITMVAFLLQLRLFQLVWTAKRNDGNKTGFWIGEGKATSVSLALYILGGLLIYQFNWTRKGHVNQAASNYNVQQEHSMRGDLRTYASLVLDGFLLPQILLNIFKDSAKKALSRSFYIGISIVRLAPHAYNQYRAHNYPVFDVKETYYYGNSIAGFCSTALDVIVSCGIIGLAVIVFIQQQYGGRCILPRRLRGIGNV